MAKRSLDKPSTWVRQAGLLTAIPLVLLAGPATGYYLGTILDVRWPFAPWGAALGAALGLAASARVIAQWIRQTRETHDDA